MFLFVSFRISSLTLRDIFAQKKYESLCVIIVSVVLGFFFIPSKIHQQATQETVITSLGGIKCVNMFLDVRSCHSSELISVTKCRTSAMSPLKCFSSTANYTFYPRTECADEACDKKQENSQYRSKVEKKIKMFSLLLFPEALTLFTAISSTVAVIKRTQICWKYYLCSYNNRSL